jgi:hypothetical protein
MKLVLAPMRLELTAFRLQSAGYEPRGFLPPPQDPILGALLRTVY